MPSLGRAPETERKRRLEKGRLSRDDERDALIFISTNPTTKRGGSKSSFEKKRSDSHAGGGQGSRGKTKYM